MNLTGIESQTQNLRSRYRGCLLAGAVGDALGAPIEMMSLSEIRKQFGEGGLTTLAPAYGGIGMITDDTQMSLFTAEGLLRAQARQNDRGLCNPQWIIKRAYFRWLMTQGVEAPEDEMPVKPESSWLFNVPELHARRLPGTTCLTSLQRPQGKFKEDSLVAKNNSKGCGGVMRVAPVGLFLAGPGSIPHGNHANYVRQDFSFAGKISLLTHGHPLSTLSSGAMASLVHLLVWEKSLPEAISIVKELLGESDDGMVIWRLLVQASDLAASKLSSAEAIKKLGEGWVAEEALAIAVYACLRGSTLEEALLIAVNHDGDSDSTGSIAGNLMGAWHGVEAIPRRWREKLELVEVIGQVADDLLDYHGWEQEDWARYPPY